MAYGFNNDKSKEEIYSKEETYSKDEVYSKEEVYSKNQLKSAVKTDGDQVTVTVPSTGEATAVIPLPFLKGKAILGITRVDIGVKTKVVPLLSFGITEDNSGNPRVEVVLGNNTNNSIGTGVIVEVAYID